LRGELWVGWVCRWSGKNSPRQVRDVATFGHMLKAGVRAKGFAGRVSGEDVFVLVFVEGKFRGEITTADVLSAAQRSNWGID